MEGEKHRGRVFPSATKESVRDLKSHEEIGSYFLEHLGWLPGRGDFGHSVLIYLIRLH